MYIYDALNNRFCTISSKEDILNDNKYADFLISSNFRDIKKPCAFEIKYPYSEEELNNMFTRSIKSITLSLTERCNLRCEYCGYMPKYSDESYLLKDMSRDVAYKAIDLLMNNSHESELCHLGFYGGEPLLRLDLIEECINYINRKYPFRKPSYNIVTNAVLLNDKVADYFIENDIHVIISFDGPKQHHNKYRVDYNGVSSYERVYQNIQVLYKKDPKFFRTHVTYNVVLCNGTSNELFESIDSLWKSDVNIIEPMLTEHFINTRDKNKDIVTDEKINPTTYDFANRNMLKSMKKYYNSFHESMCGNIIFPGGFCTPGIRKNFVTANGKIVVCEKVDESQEVFHIGDVYRGIDADNVKRLINETLRRVEKCKYCWAAKFCKLCFKDILNIDDDFCKRAKSQVESELGFYFDNICNKRELINYVSNISLT